MFLESICSFSQLLYIGNWIIRAQIFCQILIYINPDFLSYFLFLGDLNVKLIHFDLHFCDFIIEFFEGNVLELYNLAADPAEKNNLATREPARARELRDALAAWRMRVGARLPTPNPQHDPARATELGGGGGGGAKRKNKAAAP